MNLDKFKEWIDKLKGNANEVMVVVVGLVAVVAAGVCLIKGIVAISKNKDYKAGALWILAGIMIGVVAALGITKLLDAGKAIVPELSMLPYMLG